MVPREITFDASSTLRRVRWRYVGTEFIVIFTAVMVYFLVRGVTQGSVEAAYENADRLIRLQNFLGIGWEATMQGWITHSHAMVSLMNWVYIWGHWPVITLVAAWLVLTRPPDYRLVRNAFLISGGIGLIIFATFPVAPPRFVDPEIVDTVTRHSNSYRVLQPPALTNLYAALPSLHFGWNLLIGITLVWKARSVIGKGFGLMLPPAMFLSIILTGNHYILDAVAGAIVALIGLSLALWLRHRRAKRNQYPPDNATASPS